MEEKALEHPHDVTGILTILEGETITLLQQKANNNTKEIAKKIQPHHKWMLSRKMTNLRRSEILLLQAIECLETFPIIPLGTITIGKRGISGT